MKKIISLSLLLCCLLFSACSQSSVGIIGGADGPTSIFVSSGNRDDVAPVGKSVRMIRIDNELYYGGDTESEIDARCGVMDGKVSKGVDEYCVPTKNNQSNFDGEYEYQLCTETTVELVVDGKWMVYNKVIADKDISGYEYCLYLKGTMPNAEKESELIVMTHDKNLTFEQATKSLYSSSTADHLDIWFVDMK